MLQRCTPGLMQYTEAYFETVREREMLIQLYGNFESYYLVVALQFFLKKLLPGEAISTKVALKKLSKTNVFLQVISLEKGRSQRI